MIPDYGEPLPAEDRDAAIEDSARFIVRRGLETPAILALEMHRPLAGIAGNGLVFATPLLGPLLGIDRMQKLARLLIEPGVCETLIRRIEDLSEETMTSSPDTISREQTA